MSGKSYSEGYLALDGSSVCVCHWIKAHSDIVLASRAAAMNVAVEGVWEAIGFRPFEGGCSVRADCWSYRRVLVIAHACPTSVSFAVSARVKLMFVRMRALPAHFERTDFERPPALVSGTPPGDPQVDLLFLLSRS